MSAKFIMQTESHGGSVSKICYFQNLKQWRCIIKELKLNIIYLPSRFVVENKTTLTLDEWIVLALWFAWC